MPFCRKHCHVVAVGSIEPAVSGSGSRRSAPQTNPIAPLISAAHRAAPPLFLCNTPAAYAAFSVLHRSIESATADGTIRCAIQNGAHRRPALRGWPDAPTGHRCPSDGCRTSTVIARAPARSLAVRRLPTGGRHRLVDDHVLTRAERRLSEREMRVVGRGDHHQIHAGVDHRPHGIAFDRDAG